MKAIHKPLSPSVVKTWIFLAHATDPKLTHAKNTAIQQLKQSFGSVELAQIYIEQRQDKQVEVVII